MCICLCMFVRVYGHVCMYVCIFSFVLSECPHSTRVLCWWGCFRLRQSTPTTPGVLVICGLLGCFVLADHVYSISVWWLYVYSWSLVQVYMFIFAVWLYLTLCVFFWFGPSFFPFRYFQTPGVDLIS